MKRASSAIAAGADIFLRLALDSLPETARAVLDEAVRSSDSDAPMAIKRRSPSWKRNGAEARPSLRTTSSATTPGPNLAVALRRVGGVVGARRGSVLDVGSGDGAPASALASLLPQLDLHGRRARRHVFERLQPLAAQCKLEIGEPGSVAARRAKLATKPWPTGSATLADTIGMARVACSAAVRPAEPVVMITSGWHEPIRSPRHACELRSPAAQ